MSVSRAQRKKRAQKRHGEGVMKGREIHESVGKEHKQLLDVKMAHLG